MYTIYVHIKYPKLNIDVISLGFKNVMIFFENIKILKISKIS